MERDPHIDQTEQFVIDRAKDMRLAAGMSQADLAAHLNVSYGFVGQVENPKFRTKYNIRHINTLAIIFKCSPRDFLPELPLPDSSGT